MLALRATLIVSPLEIVAVSMLAASKPMEVAPIFITVLVRIKAALNNDAAIPISIIAQVSLLEESRRPSSLDDRVCLDKTTRYIPLLLIVLNGRKNYDVGICFC